MTALDPMCARCAAWRRISLRDSAGECRRRAPAALSVPAVHWREREPWSRPLWPATLETDWCGEFVALPDGGGEG